MKSNELLLHHISQMYVTNKLPAQYFVSIIRKLAATGIVRNPELKNHSHALLRLNVYT